MRVITVLLFFTSDCAALCFYWLYPIKDMVKRALKLNKLVNQRANQRTFIRTLSLVLEVAFLFK